MEGQRAFEQWKEAQAQRDENSRQDFANTDEALKLYNQTHSPLPPNALKFSDYYKPSNSQKVVEMAYVGGGMLAIGYLASKFI